MDSLIARAAAGSRIKKPLLLLLLLVPAGVGACLPVDPVPFVTVQVRVLDQDGVPIPGAEIWPIGGWYWSHRRAVGHTNRDGRAEFSLPPASYDVHVLAPSGFRHMDPDVPATYARVELERDPVDVVLVLARL